MYKTYIDPILNILHDKKLRFRLGAVYVATVADDLAFLSKFKDELQFMFGEAVGFSGQRRYQIHPVKTQAVSLTGLNYENDSWLMGENKLTLSHSTVYSRTSMARTSLGP